MRKRIPLAVPVIAVLVLAAGPLLGGGAIKRNVEPQLGVRFATAPPANARVGSTFEAVVVDPAKLSALGFANVKKNEHVTLKVTGPNNEFEVLHGASRVTKSFALNPQGVVTPRSAAPGAQHAEPK